MIKKIVLSIIIIMIICSTYVFADNTIIDNEEINSDNNGTNTEIIEPSIDSSENNDNDTNKDSEIQIKRIIIMIQT